MLTCCATTAAKVMGVENCKLYTGLSTILHGSIVTMGCPSTGLAFSQQLVDEGGRWCTLRSLILPWFIFMPMGGHYIEGILLVMCY